MPNLKYYNTNTSQWETLVVGAKGETGEQGPVGPQGPAGLGSVAVNSPIINSGTSTEAVLGLETVPVNKGGTGATTLALGGYLKGAGTSAITSQSGIPATDLTSGVLNHARMPSGTVLQVQTVRTGPSMQTISSLTPVALTGMSISFTPRFATSKIVIQAQISTSATYVASFAIYKGSSKTVSTSGATNRNEPDTNVTTYFGGSSGPDFMYSIPIIHLEDAVDTSARTYSIRATSGWSGVLYDLRINNRGGNDMASFSVMTIMEIAG